MTLQQLKYVIAIADSGSVNSAAKSLYISQPSLSSAVKELEEAMEVFCLSVKLAAIEKLSGQLESAS